MKIGELAAKVGCLVETVRYYERSGMLPCPVRSAGNYRLYGAAHQERLTFIRHCRSLDMSLEEIRILLAIRDDPERDCGEVNTLLDNHVTEVANRIAQLGQLQSQLLSLRSACRTVSQVKSCGILQDLASEAGMLGAGNHGAAMEDI